MKIIGRGLKDKISERTKVISGVVQDVTYSADFNQLVAIVRLDSGKDIYVPYKSGLEIGTRVKIEGDSFFQTK